MLEKIFTLIIFASIGSLILFAMYIAYKQNKRNKKKSKN